MLQRYGDDMRILFAAELFRKADYSMANLENIFGNKEGNIQ